MLLDILYDIQDWFMEEPFWNSCAIIGTAACLIVLAPIMRAFAELWFWLWGIL